MSVVSFTFLAFLLVSFLLYYILPKKIQPYVLLASSVVFYLFSGLDNLIIVVLTMLVVYIFSRFMQKNLDEMAKKIEGLDRKAARPIRDEMKKKRKKFLVLSLIIVIAILAVLKYTNFVIVNLNELLNVMHLGQIRGLELVVPLGISFYTFMMISYLTDIYQGKISAEKNFFKYASYVLYFPHVTQGPIARYNIVAPQIYAQRKFNYDMFVKGLWLMLWGYFKKMVIADGMAVFTDVIFGGWNIYEGMIFLWAGVLYSIQIYCDFSGCMDIVRGASECFGIKLSENFERPYFSQSLPEFWRRWHISLGSFFKDYIFYPVSTSGMFLKINTGARKVFGSELGRILASCVPILSVWLLTGLWHGPSWNFICWGLFHGILISLSTAFEQPIDKLSDKLHIKRDRFSFSFFRMLRTFFLCVIGRIIFIAPTMEAAITMLKKTFSSNPVTPIWSDFCEYEIHYKQLSSTLLICCLILLAVSVAQELMKKSGSTMTIRDWLAKQNIWFRWLVLIIGLLAVFVLGNYGAGAGRTFIYEQF